MGRSRIRPGLAMTLVAVAALDFRAALPSATLIRGAGHWVGVIVLQGILIAALRRHRLSPWLIGFEVVGWAYLACRAPYSAPAVLWWEDTLARWLVGVETRLRGASWGIDRWYVSEVHIESIQLVLMLALASIGGSASRRLCAAAVWPGRVPAHAALEGPASDPGDPS